MQMRAHHTTKRRHSAWYQLAVMALLALLSLIPVGRVRADSAQPLRVVATTTQAADVARIIGGDRIAVIGLMGPGVDPHLYQATEADINAMSQADVILYSGLHLEGQFDRIFEALGQRSVRTYALAEPVEVAGFVLPAFDSGGPGVSTPDPHFWFDPRNWQLVVGGVVEVLSEMDPANADFFRANAEAYTAQLEQLYAWAYEGMQQIPAPQRYLVTSHDAFQYFGDAFGWEMRGLQGISTEDEAGVGDVQGVVDFVVNNGIPVMFVESSVPPDAIEAVQEGAEARGRAVGIGVRELYSDAMGTPGTFGGTYIGMVAENVITILQSYGYPVPPWPDGLTPEPSPALLAQTDVKD